MPSVQTHIYNSIIKTVGDPDKRFNEDGLRILRSIRFASTLSFEIEEETKGYVDRRPLVNTFLFAESFKSSLLSIL